MGNINVEWHEKNKMPKKPTADDRIKWHLEHVNNCPCRGIPAGVIELIQKRGIKIPLVKKLNP